MVRCTCLVLDILEVITRKIRPNDGAAQDWTQVRVGDLWRELVKYCADAGHSCDCQCDFALKVLVNDS